ncbi:MAG: hypothetical protein V4719_00335, partial [Planctomycetota bacterium]
MKRFLLVVLLLAMGFTALLLTARFGKVVAADRLQLKQTPASVAATQAVAAAKLAAEKAAELVAEAEYQRLEGEWRVAQCIVRGQPIKDQGLLKLQSRGNLNIRNRVVRELKLSMELDLSKTPPQMTFTGQPGPKPREPFQGTATYQWESASTDSSLGDRIRLSSISLQHNPNPDLLPSFFQAKDNSVEVVLEKVVNKAAIAEGNFPPVVPELDPPFEEERSKPSADQIAATVRDALAQSFNMSIRFGGHEITLPIVQEVPLETIATAI